MLRHLTAKIAGEPSSQDFKTTTPKQQRTVRMWKCDVCGKPFPDFDEACQHEEDCRRRRHEKDCANAAKSTAAASSAQQQPRNEQQQSVHPFFVNKNKAEANNAKETKETKQVWVCNVCNKRSNDFDEACQHEKKCRDKKQRTRAAAAAAKPKPVHPFFQEGEKAKGKKMSSSGIIELDDSSPEQQRVPSGKRKASQQGTATAMKKSKPSVKQKRGRTTNSSANNNNNKTEAAELASIFTSSVGGASQLLAEHRAAEFVAKRRAEAERERQRQQRRRENAELKQQQQVNKKAPPAVKKSQRLLYPAAVRFPNPTHVVPSAEQSITAIDSSSTCKGLGIDQDMLTLAHKRLNKTPRYPGSQRCTDVPDDCPTLLSRELPIQRMNPLQKLMSDLLIPPNKPSSSDGLLWCHKYGIQSVPQDVCGQHNRETAQELLKFVDEWKVERQKAHERRAEKQQALLKRKKKKRKTDGYDDIWIDSDDEDDGLRSVCLITGPTGCGKTNLVHAVARQSDCVVLEINTTERRGGQALKHAIEEATQSDSTLDMLKKSTISAEIDPFQDSDDESEAEGKGSSVIVILIDEVDLLYEDEGDTGFWTALSSLTKRAKCPILLTANAVPDSLLSTSIRYVHLEMMRPTPEECASRMCKLIKDEGFERHEPSADGPNADEQLSRIAQLCRCDLRSIYNELQLFAGCPVRAADDVETIYDTIVPDTVDSRTEHSIPRITGISPKQVSPYDSTLLTIKGENFSRFSTDYDSEASCKVTIGNLISHAAQVMDDTTILAVCPPCLLPLGVNETGVFEETLKECRTSRFALVSICGHDRNGAIITTDAALSTCQLCDDTPVTCLAAKANVEYCFPAPRRTMLEYAANRGTDDDDNTEEEFELESPGGLKPSPSVPTETSFQRTDSVQEATALLEESVRKWDAEHPQSPVGGDDEDKSQSNLIRESESARKVEIWASQAELASDVSLLQDTFEYGGVPFLAGAVSGFGASLVNDIAGNNVRHTSEGDQKKLLRNVNARPPNFEKLYSLGWNEEGCFFGSSNSFMRYPTDSRERMLLARGESHERGLSQPLSKGLGAADAFEDEDQHDLESDPSLSEALALTDAATCDADECLFIRPTCASSISPLPEYIERLSKSLDSSYHPLAMSDLARLPLARKDDAFHKTGLLSDLIQDEADVNKHHFVRSIARLTDMSTTPFQDRMEQSMFLDYLPMLCQISMHERAAEHAFQQVCAVDLEAAAAMTGRRRTTRRSGKAPTRTHYFVRAGFCRDNSEAIVTGAELASKVLTYSGANGVAK